MEQLYEVAGLRFSMDSWGKTSAQAEPYIMHDNQTVDFKLASFWPEIRQDYPYISDEDGEYLATGARFYQHLLEYGGFMLHSSAVVVDEKAYLFSANSGTGKSTHTQLWLSIFNKKAYILNDDKPALRREADGWFAYGTPWSGKNDISVNARIPLAGIAMLERAQNNEIFPFSGVEAICQILAQVNKVVGKKYRTMLMSHLEQLFDEVPIWKLRCNMEPEAAILSYEAMSGKKFKGESIHENKR